MKRRLDQQIINIKSFEGVVQERLARMEQEKFSLRLWRKDPGLWKADPKSREDILKGLGWLHSAEKMGENLKDLSNLVEEVRAVGLRRGVLLGMGGSSLAPFVFQNAFTQPRNGLPLTVLDTTDPATVLKIERELPLKETLFIVASKSGTTAEVTAFNEYFYDKMKAIKGQNAGENFIAITDPETPLARLAQERGFRRVFLNFNDIGGRYSVLSYFGLVPASLMGIDVSDLLARSLWMAEACSPSIPIKENPGVVLGAVLGELARHGRDKVTFFVSESVAAFGLWLEQLLAESTGKESTGILPVVGESPGPPAVYGNDRLFVFICLKREVDETLESRVDALQRAGHPVIIILMEDPLDLGQEFFRWEIATATTGAILEINAFDQPNVQESKEYTNLWLTKIYKTGRLAKPAPPVEENPLRLKTFFKQARPGDYIALQAYLSETCLITERLQVIRHLFRDRLCLTTTLGYGPRYLHSTGQYHKGGPNNGLFLQLTAEDGEDVPIPGAPYTFGMFKRAQALGDLQALRKHERRVIDIHLGRDVIQGLEKLLKVIKEAIMMVS